VFKVASIAIKTIQRLLLIKLTFLIKIIYYVDLDLPSAFLPFLQCNVDEHCAEAKDEKANRNMGDEQKINLVLNFLNNKKC
jgi:hypothetical protein